MRLNEFFNLQEEQLDDKLPSLLKKMGKTIGRDIDASIVSSLSAQDRDEIQKAINSFGPSIVDIVSFAFKWRQHKYLQSVRNVVPTFTDVAKKALKNIKIGGLYRGVRVSESSKLAKLEKGDTHEIKLKKPSVSSWTSTSGVASEYASESDYDGNRWIIIQIVDPGDATCLYAPLTGNNGVSPKWFQILYAIMTKIDDVADLHANMDYDTETDQGLDEYILCLSHCTVKIVSAGSDGDRRGPEDTKIKSRLV